MSLKDPASIHEQWREQQSHKASKDKKAFPLRFARLTKSFRKFLTKTSEKDEQRNAADCIRGSITVEAAKRHVQGQNDKSNSKDKGETEISRSNVLLSEGLSDELKDISNVQTERSAIFDPQKINHFDEIGGPIFERMMGRCEEAEAVLDRLDKAYFNIHCHLTNMEASFLLALKDYSHSMKTLSSGDDNDSVRIFQDTSEVNHQDESTGNIVGSLKRRVQSLAAIVENRLPQSSSLTTKSWPDMTTIKDVASTETDGMVNAKFFYGTNIRVLSLSMGRVVENESQMPVVCYQDLFTPTMTDSSGNLTEITKSIGAEGDSSTDWIPSSIQALERLPPSHIRRSRSFHGISDSFSRQDLTRQDCLS